MICSVCGGSSDMGASFCSRCGAALQASAAATPAARLYRLRQGRVIAGVCAGFGLRYGWDPIVVRLVLVLAVFLGVGTPVVAYVIAWIVMPNGPYALPGVTGPTIS